ncbi:MAG: phosphogluconate dehydrogenase (NAD(+)-dependent, decarboxylating) [Oligoflexales bacterium]
MHINIGIIGLGKMGGGLALQAMEKGIGVVGYTLDKPSSTLIEAGLQRAAEISALKQLLPQRRVVFIYVPAGKAVDAILEELSNVLEKGDIVLDGGNSYWGDSMHRYHTLSQHGIHFIDLGTSGGVSGARQGACFMAGGDREPVEFVQKIIEMLAVPGGFVYAGPPGAGHFTKLVHNGIEFGMLEAIGEGIDLLERWPHAEIATADVLKCWAHGSVIRSWLIELMEQAYREHKGMEDIPPHVEDTGEVNWLVSDALKMEVPVPVISQSVNQLFSSRDKQKRWARAIAMMRHGFGGHPYGPDAAIAEERRSGRVM